MGAAHQRDLISANNYGTDAEQGPIRILAARHGLKLEEKILGIESDNAPFGGSPREGEAQRCIGTPWCEAAFAGRAFQAKIGSHVAFAIFKIDGIYVVINVEGFEVVEGGVHAIKKLRVESGGIEDAACFRRVVSFEAVGEALKERLRDLRCEIWRAEGLLGLRLAEARLACFDGLRLRVSWLRLRAGRGRAFGRTTLLRHAIEA